MRIPLWKPCMLLLLHFLTCSATVKAQKTNKKTDTTKTKPDTAKPLVPILPPNSPKPYKEVITANAISDTGLFMVHKVDDKYYFEINDSLLGRDILLVNRIVKAAIESNAYAGDDIGSRVLRFVKGNSNKLYLQNISYSTYAKDSTSPMFMAVKNSNLQSNAASFDIKAFSKDSTGSLIEITGYINSDNDLFNFTSGKKANMGIMMFVADRSYIQSIKAFPLNTEITTVKTYAKLPNEMLTALEKIFGVVVTQNTALTLELNSSLILLPKTPMQPRYADLRVGYFSTGYTDYDANPQGVKQVEVVKRWRMEPKPEDLEKYKLGELVEPQKPIVFYIDPATPKKWVPYLMRGVNDWQKAFEKAGFKNAILAKEAPTKGEDSTWSLEDARHSAIVYKPSATQNAQGPSICDPRSGEIMESHVNWFHNVMSLIHDWYFIQCGPLDTAAQKMIFDDELMGQLIRFVSSHEIGHTLGLLHNFGSSSTVPVEKLRDKAWVETFGHTPSIMDYARFNYVAQPEDNISRAGLFPRIGDYDKWAIEWGYRLFPQYADADAEKSHLNKWVIDKLKNKRLWYGAQKIGGAEDPRSQDEQVGDDAMKANGYGIKNLQRVLLNLEDWTRTPGKDFEDLFTMYIRLTNQFRLYMKQVTQYVGGVMETIRTADEKGPVFEAVPKNQQQEAVAFLNKQLFATPTWLINKAVYEKAAKFTTSGVVTTRFDPIKTIGDLQTDALKEVMSNNRLSRLLATEAAGNTSLYSVADLFTDLKKGIWTELTTKKTIDIYRRNLQKNYIDIVGNMISPPVPKANDPLAAIIAALGTMAPIDKTDIISVAKVNLAAIRSEAKTTAATAPDAMTRYHLQDIVTRIDIILQLKK